MNDNLPREVVLTWARSQLRSPAERPYRCIAYTEAGTICGKPAGILDEQRGGYVCEEHTPEPF